VSKTITIDQLSKEIERMLRRARKSLRGSLNYATEKGQDELKATAPVLTGIYRKGIIFKDATTTKRAVRGAILFLAPHSHLVRHQGSHPSAEKILDRVPKTFADHSSQHLTDAMLRRR